MRLARSGQPYSPWLSIRKELGPQRRFYLTIFSFLGPLITWAFVSYVPLVWHPDVKLQIAADRENITTVFTAGDRQSPDFFITYQDAVRIENEQLRQALAQGDDLGVSGFSARRANLKIIRHLGPAAVANKWLTREEAQEDANLYALWGKIARGEIDPQKGKVKLLPANVEIIERNWAKMAEKSSTFESKLLPEEPLEKLIPQGVRANPVFLPAPHELIQTGWEDFTHVPADGKPTMLERYGQSLRIVFLGFLLSCLIAIPLGILCGTFDFFSKLFEPFIDFFRYMPAPAFSTLLVAIFLAHDAPKIALIFLGTFFQMVLVVANTTRQLDTSLIEAAQTLGAKRLTLIRRVILPGITPHVYNDLRILLGWAWTWLVIAELIGVKSGLTEFIETQGRWRNFDSVYPVIILIGLTGFFTDQLLASLRKYFFPWTPESADKKPGPIGRTLLWITDRNVYETPVNGKERS